jgi:hypothetical protein
MSTELRFMMFFVGIVISIAGLMILIIRLMKTGAIHLVRPGKPGRLLWFYFFADDEVKITPSLRYGERLSYNPEMDSQIVNAKTYRLADHVICIVPEVVGGAVDLDYAMYADIAQTKWGWENLKEARKSAVDRVLSKIGIRRTIEKEGQVHVISGRDISKVTKEAERIRG